MTAAELLRRQAAAIREEACLAHAAAVEARLKADMLDFRAASLEVSAAVASAIDAWAADPATQEALQPIMQAMRASLAPLDRAAAKLAQVQR
jgi:hypothetical protein